MSVIEQVSPMTRRCLTLSDTVQTATMSDMGWLWGVSIVSILETVESSTTQVHLQLSG
jgi:hypothetical protein